MNDDLKEIKEVKTSKMTKVTHLGNYNSQVSATKVLSKKQSHNLCLTTTNIYLLLMGVQVA